MEEEKDDGLYLIKVKSPLINFLQKVILYSIKVLAIFMTIVIIWSIIDVGLVMFDHIIQPPYLLLKFEEILGLFGGFLVVLIAIEIFLNIILYLRKDMNHIRLVVATALMAIARKVIILDYEKIASIQLYGIAATIIALGIAYWLVRTPYIEN